MRKENPMFQTFFENALIGLENGSLTPWDKDLLSHTPLPDSVIDPYTAREVPDVLDSMNLTYSAMSVWIEEAKKINYFSKRFTELSRLIMKGVTTMGRGLVTMHRRGEDLKAAPMSIFDLIGVASYHFRKSYLGVLQTSRSNPEIGERLLMNQIGWNNMLMRLYKTREKLAKPVSRGSLSAAGGDPETNIQLPDDGSQKLSADKLLPASASEAFPPVSALMEPGAFNAPRAFSSFENEYPETKKKRNRKPEVRNEIEETKITDEEKKNGDEAKKQKNEENPSEIEAAGWKKQEKAITENDENRTDNEKNDAANEKDQETGIQNFAETRFSDQDPETEITNAGPEVRNAGSIIQNTEPAAGLPIYLKILQDVMGRSGQSENGELTFTFDELCYLAADSDFNRIYPDQGAQMRSILQNMDSS